MSVPLVVELEDEAGLVFWPAFEIASLVPEFGGRWRAVDGQGRIAYRPGPPAQGPWRRLGEGLVLPHLLVIDEGGVWRDPAGFALGRGELEPVALPALREPLKGVPCSPDQVIRLESVPPWSCQWVTEVGTFLVGSSVGKVASRMPELVAVTRSFYVPRFRLRRFDVISMYGWVELDDGSRTRLSFASAQGFAKRLGLSEMHHLQPYCKGLWRDGKRDYVFELARAPGSRLRELFGSARRLIAHLVWQAFRYRQQGLETDYGNGYRAFWYAPLAPALYRAGFLTRDELEERVPEEGGSSTGLYLQFQTQLAEMVGDDRLFTFGEFGFVDPGGERRGVGAVHPEVVVLIEKESMLERGRRLATEFGLSWMVTGGHVPWIGSEYLAADLRAAGVTEVRVLALCDWDPAGWWIGQTLPRHLQRYGLDGEVEYLVRPECFSAEELELYCLPCPTPSVEHETMVANWVAETGGVGGRAYGIHADHLWPYERLRERVRDMLGSGN